MMMVALMLPQEVAAKVAQPGGEPPERLHCTLAYPGVLADLPADAEERATRAVRQVAEEFGPLVGLLGGVGRFNAPKELGGRDCIHATLDAPMLPALREAVVRELEAAGLAVSREHGFDPHVTLRYEAAGKAASLPTLATAPVVFGAVSVVAGDRRTDIPLVGSRIAKADEAGAVDAAVQKAESLLRAGVSERAAIARAALEGGLSSDEVMAAIAKARQPSREYLEEALAEARKTLPAWAWATIHRQAFPRAGARAARERDDSPTALEKVALRDIRPRALREFPDEELRAAWLRLNQWYANAKRRGRAVEDVVNAALWTSDEMRRRGFEVDDESELARATADLRSRAGKSRRSSVEGEPGQLPKHLGKLLEGQPEEILLVRDWVSVAGSAAVAEKPNDIDLVVRSQYKDGHFLVDGATAQVALRRFLAPKGSKVDVQLVPSPAGPHSDHVPLYDLVARRRVPSVNRIESEPAKYEGQDRVVKSLPNGVAEVGIHLHNLERENRRTKADGAHAHLYHLDDGTTFWTEEDGEHVHALSSETANDVQPDGSHVHRVVLPGVLAERWGVKQLLTSDEGQHGHQLQAVSTAFDGAHGHSLQLPDGVVIRNLSAGEYWAAHGREPQANNPPAPPASELAEREKPEMEEVRQQAETTSAARRQEATASKREDKLTPGDFFFMPKPTRPVQPEQPATMDAVISFGSDRLPVTVQKKFDGMRLQVHKQGQKVLLLTEEGLDATPRLPGLAKEVAKLKPETLVLDAELEAWRGRQHLPREVAAARISAEGEPDESGLILAVFDVLFHSDNEEGDVHKRSLVERLELLNGLDLPQPEGPPGSAKLISVRGERATSPDELRNAIERLRQLPGSEGVVVKRDSSPYPLDLRTPDTWWKFHNVTTVRGLVLDGRDTRGGVRVYRFGVLPGRRTPAETEKLGAKEVVPVGDTFSTSLKLANGDRILVEAETVNLIETADGVELGVYAPRVLGGYEGEPDTVDAATARAREALVLQVKRVGEDGEVEYLPPSVQKCAEVPTAGRPGAEVLFVGASPSAADRARGEHLVGPTGETLAKSYLAPLGLTRGEVAITSAVPLALMDAGKVREPVVKELAEWREWLSDEVQRISPRVLVALGRTAGHALEAAIGKAADFVLPHPSVVRRCGDRGEVGRKVRAALALLQERRALGLRFLEVEKQEAPSEEGGEDTRGGAALENWEKRWHEMLPKSGGGRFTYQQHFRGLEEDEVGLGREALMNTGHSVHGDIRFEGEDGLWGWAVLIGDTADNRRRKQQDKLLDWREGDKLQLAPKLLQPKQWLDVGKRQPMVTAPGGVGATSNKSAKFFAIDGGSYRLGVARQHSVEVFLDGKSLNGRYVIQFAPLGGRRVWLIDKPEDQTPAADSQELADVLAELKRKRQDYLVWGKPGQTPQKYSVRTGEVAKSATVSLLKALSDAPKRIVYGVVLDPYVVDAHNDVVPPAEIEATAHEWLKSTGGLVNLHHKTSANAHAVESFVEAYPTPEDYRAAMAGKPHRAYRRKYGDDVVHSGAWVIGVQLDEALWAAVERGEIAAFSIEGFGVKTPTEKKAAIADVRFTDIVPKVETWPRK